MWGVVGGGGVLTSCCSLGDVGGGGGLGLGVVLPSPAPFIVLRWIYQRYALDVCFKRLNVMDNKGYVDTRCLDLQECIA